MPDPRPAIRMKGISKRFGTVSVLRNVDFEAHAGEVHLLAGENGAGKSTLIKIAAGVYQDYDGLIEIDGSRVRPISPAEARSLGVAVIYQELSIVPSMTVADNLFLGRFLCSGGFVSDRRQRVEAQAALGSLGIDLDCRRLAGELPVSAQQMIEIAKALTCNARVVIMDEPTSALNAVETKHLFDLVARLKQSGCAVIYITHKMEEIYQIADRITVLRDGSRVGTAPAAELPLPQLIEWMVGRTIEEQFERHPVEPGSEMFRVQNFSVRHSQPGHPPLVDDTSFSVRAGEILGFAGLQGSGNTELFWGLFGAMGTSANGQVFVNEQRVPIRSPQEAIRSSLALLTNDRKTSGLVLPMPVTTNIVLASLDRLARGGWRNKNRERGAAESAACSVHLRAASLDMEAGQLSGGNQQKVVLAKWMETRPRVLLLDDPTRGVDIGAKREIYKLMNEWTSSGMVILLISSELPELLGMSDRLLVMHRGRVTAEFDRRQATPQAVLAAAMGHGESRSIQ
jgi:ABC-type sugar transport system ATPase subunit